MNPKILLDTDKVLRCGECNRGILPQESKILVGYPNLDIGAYLVMVLCPECATMRFGAANEQAQA